PEPGYGWEKLYTEELCRYYRQDYGFQTRIVSLHNAYGPLASYAGGKEKAPAAISPKVALAPGGGELEAGRDGKQTRSFIHVDDCVEGVLRLMASVFGDPVNLGSEQLVAVDGLIDIVSAIAGKTLVKRHDVSKPQGVRGRNSDNPLVQKVLG